MRKKIVLWGGTVILTAGMLTGCGKMTKENLLKQSKEAMEKAESFAGDMELDCEISVGIGDYSQNMDLYGDMELKVTPDIVYIGGNIGSESAFMLMPMEMYVETGEDGKSGTVYMNIANKWQKSEVEQDEESEEEADDSDLLEKLQSYTDKFYEDLQLSEELGEVGGEETYVLTGTMEGSNIQDLLQFIMSESEEDQASMEDLGISFDFASMDFDMEMQYFKESKLPASMKLEMKEAAPVMESEMMQMTYENMTVSFIYKDYGKVEKIEIPQEALDAESADVSDEMLDILEEDEALLDDDYGYEDYTDDDDWYDETELLTDEDGNYIVMDYEGTMQLSIPARENGYGIGSEASSTYLYFEKDNGDMYSILEYSVEVFGAVSTESDLEEYIPLYASYLEEDADTEDSMYQDIELSGLKEKDVDGQTVKYQYFTYSMQGVPCCWGNAWIVSEDGSCALLVNCNLSAEEEAIDESWVEDAFRGIRAANM